MTTVGRKHDSDKSRWDLVPWDAMEVVVRVLTYGARKYAPGNWQTIEEPRERYIAAAFRHLTARARGELIDRVEDGGSGELHVAHAICCLLFLIWHDAKAAQTVDVQIVGPTVTEADLAGQIQRIIDRVEQRFPETIPKKRRGSK